MNHKIVLLTSSSTPDSGGISYFQKTLYSYCNNSNIEIFEKCYNVKRAIDFYKPGKKIIQIINYIRKIKPDLIVLNDPHLGFLFWSALFTRHRVLIFSHGWVFHNRNNFIRSFIFNLLSVPLFFLNNRCNIYCVSKQDYKRLPNFVNKFVVGNPIRFKTDTLKKKVTNNFVFVGRNVPHKNIQYLIDFFNKNSNLKLTIVTDNDNFNYNNNINVCINLNDKSLLELYQSSKFFISFSSFEGYGMAIVEAMACGCIPILSNIPSHVEHVKNSGSGFIFSRIDEILYYLENSHVFEKHSKMASEYAGKFYFLSFWKKIFDKKLINY